MLGPEKNFLSSWRGRERLIIYFFKTLAYNDEKMNKSAVDTTVNH